jgi:hypothetical protein
MKKNRNRESGCSFVERMKGAKAEGAAVLIASVAFCCVIGVLLTRPGNDRNALLGIDGARERAQADQSMVRFPNGFPNLVHYVVLSAVWLFPTPMRIGLRLRGLAERYSLFSVCCWCADCLLRQFSIAFERAKQDKQAAVVQRRLAKKDIRLSQTLAQAASVQAAEAVALEQKVTAAVRQRAIMEGRVHNLASVLSAQEQELTLATTHLDEDSKNEFALHHALPQLHRAKAHLQAKIARVKRAAQRAEKGLKTQRIEEKKAKQVLRQSMRAYKNYRIRAENDQEKKNFAITKASLLRAKALVAARKVRLDQTTALTDVVKDPAKVEKLRLDETNKEAAAALLKAQAEESIKKSQVWDAKEQEAASYEKMMKADVQAAEQRVIRKENMQRTRAMYRLEQRQLEGELHEAKRELRKGDMTSAKLLHEAVQNKGVVSMGIKDVRHTRQGLARAVRGVEHAQLDAVLASRDKAQDREHVNVDEEQAQALRIAANEHQVAAGHWAEAEKKAAAEARGLVGRAKDLLTFASEDKKAVDAEQQLRSLDAAAQSLSRSI